jgi:hypothetical protein
MSVDRESRRRWLGLVAAGALLDPRALIARAHAQAGSAIRQLDGTARVNGREARVGTPVAAGDRISTGSASQAVVVVGTDAFLLRSDTTLEVRGRGGILSELSLAAGRLLSVFGKKPVAIRAASASIGIRGTGAYLEVDPVSVYLCLCYGEARVEGPGVAPLDLRTRHHERPLLMRTDSTALRIEPGPFRDHKDSELVLLESLVGREPPFMGQAAYPGGQY